jgi:hypothetical protein
MLIIPFHEHIALDIGELMEAKQHTTNWPDLAAELYDRLTGRNAQITYDFSDLQIKIPSGTGPEAEHAEWLLNGAVKITTHDGTSDPN